MEREICKERYKGLQEKKRMQKGSRGERRMIKMTVRGGEINRRREMD